MEYDLEDVQEDTYCDEVMCADPLYKVPEERMGEPKFRHIGALRFRNNKIKSQLFGSGCLISSNLVLTAAHNIFRWGQESVDMEFYPGQCG